MVGLAVLAAAAIAGAEVQGVSGWVDPRIGSHGAGNVFIGPSMPFGMIKPSPDVGKNDANAGWRPSGPINGFSQTHVSGTGGGAKYGNVLLMPANGELDLADFSSDRKDERIELGYYGTELTRYGIRAEVTCLDRAAIYRFTYPAAAGAKVVFDAGHLLYFNIAGEGQRLVASSVRVLSPREVSGSTCLTGGWNLQKKPFTVYFYAVVDTPAAEFGVFRGGEAQPGAMAASVDGATRTGAWLTFPGAEARTVNLKIGISFASEERARRNAATLKGLDFEAVRARNRSAWDGALGAVRAETADEDRRRLFYTTLYHAMLMPVDRTGDNPLWESAEPYYDDFYAIWDTFRTSGPLLTLIVPERQRDIVRALVDMHRHEGFLPDGRSGNSNGRTQGGSDADVYIADAFVKGIRGVDWKAAYAALKTDAEVEPLDGNYEGRGGVKDWIACGYLPVEGFKLSGCKNVEYAYNDFCVMQLARKLGTPEEVRKYAARAAQWQNVWDPDFEEAGFRGFIRPRHRDGRWLDGFNAMQGCSWGGDTFYEGNSWTYSFYVPQDVRALMAKCGGEETFVKRLDELFNGRCDASNEPFFLTPYLYIWAGRHDLAADRVRKVASRYSARGDGIPGNDDSGALGAWYSFSAMGIFPVAGQDVYLIGSPLFERVDISLDGGRKFTIRADGTSKERLYVTGATLNGKPLGRAWIRHSEIVAGGELALSMSDRPDNSWAKTVPPSPLSDLAGGRR